MQLIASLRLATVLLAFSIPLTAQCNDQARKREIPAGVSNEGSHVQCQTMTVDLGFGPITTVGACPSHGHTVYQGAVYTCGIPSEGNHCMAGTYKVHWTSYRYNSQPCPTLPNTADGLKKLLLKGLVFECDKAEIAQKSFDLSASNKVCATGQKSAFEHSHTEIIEDGTSGKQMMLWDPDGVAHPFAIFEANDGDVYAHPGAALLDAPVNTIPAPLDAIYSSSVSDVGFSGLNATITYRFRNSGHAAWDNVYSQSLVGAVRLNGDWRFNVVWPTAQGGLVEDHVLDRGRYAYVHEGAENGNAYAATASDRDFMLRTEAAFGKHVVNWVRDPLKVPHSTQLTWSTEVSATPGWSSHPPMQLLKAVASLAESPTHRINFYVDLSSSPARLVATELMGDLDPLFTWDFFQYTQVAPDLVRPMRTVFTDLSSERVSQVELVVTAAVPAEVGTAISFDPLPEPPHGWWLRTAASSGDGD